MIYQYQYQKRYFVAEREKAKFDPFSFLVSSSTAFRTHHPHPPTHPHTRMAKSFGRRRIHQLNEEEDASELKLGPEFQNEHCLLYAEVKILMEKLKQNNESAVNAADRHNLTPYVLRVESGDSHHCYFAILLSCYLAIATYDCDCPPRGRRQHLPVLIISSLEPGHPSIHPPVH